MQGRAEVCRGEEDPEQATETQVAQWDESLKASFSSNVFNRTNEVKLAPKSEKGFFTTGEPANLFAEVYDFCASRGATASVDNNMMTFNIDAKDIDAKFELEAGEEAPKESPITV